MNFCLENKGSFSRFRYNIKYNRKIAPYSICFFTTQYIFAAKPNSRLSWRFFQSFVKMSKCKQLIAAFSARFVSKRWGIQFKFLVFVSTVLDRRGLASYFHHVRRRRRRTASKYNKKCEFFRTWKHSQVNTY